MEWVIEILGLNGDAVSVPEMLLRVLISCICGAAIGIERNRRQKDAGTRTHLIVALGASLFMLVSKYGFFDVVSFDGINADASRIASSVVTGVSFLGAGVIFTRGTSIKGLTTSAGIWATAAVGCAVGAGMYLVGVCTTVILLIFQILLHRFFHKIESSMNAEITVTMPTEQSNFTEISDALTENGIYIQDINMTRQQDGMSTCVMTARYANDITVADAGALMKRFDKITAIDIKNI